MKPILLFVSLFLILSAFLKADPVPSLSHILKEKKYDVNFYFLDLDIEAALPDISGNVLIRSKSLVNNLDTFALELSPDFILDSVTASLDEITFQSAHLLRNGMELSVVLPFTVPVNQFFSVRVYYNGSLTSPATTTGNKHRFSMTCPYYAYTVFPCKQDLADKADSSWFFITTDASSKGLSNGTLTNVVDVTGNKKRWEWKSKYPIDFYLISFVVGEFTEYTEYFHPEERSDSMLLKYYGYEYPKGYIPGILNIFSKLFGLYPFYNEKLGIANVNLSGGMENQTMISLGAQYKVEAHEIAHQWWGDNVTCNSWRDVFCNESFATWSESVYAEFTSATPNTARISKCNNFEAAVFNAFLYGSDPNGSVYIHGTDTISFNSVFDGPMHYYKGAMVINSLRFEVNNDSIFFLGLRNYQNQFSGKTASGEDFKNVMESVTGKDFTDFFNQWYYGYGYPTFALKWNQLDDRLMLRVTETTSSAKTSLYKTSLEIKVKRVQGDTTIRLFINNNISDFNISCAGSITGFTVDPNQWILNKTGAIVNDTSLNIPTAVTDIQPVSSTVLVYPNPAKHQIKIVTDFIPEKEMDLILFNELGQQVFSGVTTSGHLVNLPNLPKGVYLLKINQKRFYKLLISQ